VKKVLIEDLLTNWKRVACVCSGLLRYVLCLFWGRKRRVADDFKLALVACYSDGTSVQLEELL
jgi:hypothetical protein